MTFVARYIFGNFKFFFYAFFNFIKGELYLNTEIGSPGHLSATATPAPCAESTKTSKAEITEYISKMREDVIHRHTTTVISAACRSTYTCMPELVIPGFFLRITQHFIRLSSFFKFVFCFFVALIAVRMKLQRLLTVCLLDFLRSGIL